MTPCTPCGIFCPTTYCGTTSHPCAFTPTRRRTLQACIDAGENGLAPAPLHWQAIYWLRAHGLVDENEGWTAARRFVPTKAGRQMFLWSVRHAASNLFDPLTHDAETLTHSVTHPVDSRSP